MNVKQGDLALIIGTKGGNEGKVVLVEHFLGHRTDESYRDYWSILIEPQLTGNTHKSSFRCACPDKFLKKLKGREVDREALRKYEEVLKEVEYYQLPKYKETKRNLK